VLGKVRLLLPRGARVTFLLSSAGSGVDVLKPGMIASNAALLRIQWLERHAGRGEWWCLDQMVVRDAIRHLYG
jgi:hypothetical protein